MPDDARTPALHTLADVIAALALVQRLTVQRRRDSTSAVRRVCALLHAAPEALPAVLNQIRPHLNALSAPNLGLAPKTVENLRSNFLAALRVTGAIRQKAGPVSPDWDRLRGMLPNKRMKNGLSRFMSFCSSAGVAPGAVDDDVAARFAVNLEANTLVAQPHDAHRRTCRLWNEGGDTVPGWPTNQLTLPNYRKPRQSLPLAAFPASFARDTACYLDWLRANDPFANDRPAHACKPRTIEQRRRQIELAASALHQRGVPVSMIVDLRVLTEVDSAKEILRFYFEKNGKKWTTFARDLAQALLSIARNWVRVDPDHLRALQQIRGTMGPARSGLTEKNTATLRQFYDSKNLQALYRLPQVLAAKAREPSASPRRRAVLMQLAVVLDILIQAPLRMGNLIAIEIGRHLIRPGGPRSPYVLVFHDGETKNAEPLEHPLSTETGALIDRYILEFRPAFAAGDATFLFPSLEGGQKSQATLAAQITDVVARYTGFRITPHQFRHLAAAVILDRYPGALHLVQRLLGHKNPKTTINFYAGLNPRGAARMMEEIVTGIRDRPMSGKLPRRPSR